MRSLINCPSCYDLCQSFNCSSYYDLCQSFNSSSYYDLCQSFNSSSYYDLCQSLFSYLLSLISYLKTARAARTSHPLNRKFFSLPYPTPHLYPQYTHTIPTPYPSQKKKKLQNAIFIEKYTTIPLVYQFSL